MAMNMGGPHGRIGTAAGGPGGQHAVANILPTWVAVIWTLVFVGIIVIHVRHLRETRGQRRLWHSGHVLMAVGMGFMFAPASIDRLNIPASFWQLTFAGAALVIAAWMLTEVAERRAVNALWLLMVSDLAAMVYMWSPPSGYRPAVTWLLVAYFVAQSVLWVSDRMRVIDQHALPSAFSVTPEGAVGTAVAAPLICFRDIRVSMSAMTFGMAYMFAAMQLLM